MADVVQADGMPAARPRVVIVDDHASFRGAARDLFTVRGWDVVAEASCGATALMLVSASEPDLVVVDVALGVESGFDVARTLTQAFPKLPVLLVSAEEHYADAADRIAGSGARGFVAKRRLPQIDLRPFLRPLRVREIT
ncbi:response regulator [Solirubrobacter soli]|uniref:response regulator n=1 Tax=Solirubrobacter soli TaxID=363832 RepID=UPI00146A9314|nr:response regulator transcription factor [Solirubrobacter soli]